MRTASPSIRRPAKELRLFGLVDWTIEPFRRAGARVCTTCSTRRRGCASGRCSGAWCWCWPPTSLVFWSLLARDASNGTLALGAVVVFAQTAVGTSMIAFGGLNWALDGAAAPVAAVLRLEAAMARPARSSGGSHAAGDAAREIRFRDVTFAYPGGSPVLEHFDLTIPAGSSLAIVGQNGAGKTTLAKLLCRLYDPQAGAIEVDGADVRTSSTWRRGVRGWPRCSRTSSASSCRCATTSRRPARPTRSCARRSGQGRRRSLAGLDTVLARGYDGGTDLSGGQWQRVALARALCAVEARRGRRAAR